MTNTDFKHPDIKTIQTVIENEVKFSMPKVPKLSGILGF